MLGDLKNGCSFLIHELFISSLVLLPSYPSSSVRACPKVVEKIIEHFIEIQFDLKVVKVNKMSDLL